MAFDDVSNDCKIDLRLWFGKVLSFAFSEAVTSFPNPEDFSTCMEWAVVRFEPFGGQIAMGLAQKP
jgi:hypothetical protein